MLWVLNLVLRHFKPKPPYTNLTGDKGRFARIAVAQPLDWTHHRLHPPGWERTGPITIAWLSDFHTGSHTDDLARLKGIVDTVNARAPDLVLLGGDYVNTQPWGGGHIPPAPIVEVLAGLTSRAGVFAILGNHDWKYGIPPVMAALEAAGIEVLENRGVMVSVGGARFGLAGLSDERRGAPDLDAALAGLPEGPTLIMAHDPVAFRRLSPGAFLMLAGHTHGGQVCLPGGRAIANASDAPLAWSQGVIDAPGRQMFVGRGIGTSLFPIRANCPPEIAFLTIGGKSDAAAPEGD